MDSFRRSARSAFLALLSTALVASCGGGGGGPGERPGQGEPSAVAQSGDSFERREAQAVQRYQQSSVGVRGVVVTEEGLPIAGAILKLAGQEVVSMPDGSFWFKGLPRKNALISVSAPGVPHRSPRCTPTDLPRQLGGNT